MTNQPILVIGASGKTGSRVASRLEAAGETVRLASRQGATQFDWDNSDTWESALAGAKAAYVTYFPDLAFPGAVDKLEMLTLAAKKIGVGKLVLLSGRGEHHAGLGEEVVRAAGIPFTVIRSAWFAQNFSEGYLREPILHGLLPMPGGDILEPIIDVEDIADVAVAALTDDRHHGQTYEVTGPDLLTFADMAAELTTATGNPIHHIPISFDDFYHNIEKSGGAFVADVFTAIARETLDGRNAHTADGVKRALGRAPRRFAEFALHAAKSGAWKVAA